MGFDAFYTYKIKQTFFSRLFYKFHFLPTLLSGIKVSASHSLKSFVIVLSNSEHHESQKLHGACIGLAGYVQFTGWCNTRHPNGTYGYLFRYWPARVLRLSREKTTQTHTNTTQQPNIFINYIFK